jgi:hypothetical protein
MLYSKDNAVRKDAMLALIRVAREMHGEGGIQKILVEQSIGKVVDFIRKSGGLEAVSAIAKIVFENLERHDCSYIAKDALLRALHDAFNTVSKELEALVERRSVLRASVDDILKDNPCACEIKAIEANLEDHASLIAEVNRLNDEKHELSWFLTAMPSGEQRSQSSVEERIRVACTRLHELREIINDISTLVERRNNLQPLVWMGMADEAEVQELAFIEERLHGLGSVRDEIEGLNSDVQSCKRQLELLKIEARLNELSESMNKVKTLQERKHELESILNERFASEPAAQELKQVNERIATLDTFTQGIIKQVSAGVARQKISEDSIQARALRGMLVDALYDLCLAHPESEKNFNKLGDLFVYMIGHNLYLEESECIELKERLLALEQLHRTPERSQKINMWLFRIGTSDLTFPGGATVAEDALVTWLDRISDARGRLSEPFPLARVGRLADALQSPHLTLESRLRIWTLLKPQLDLLAKGAQRDAERMSILQSFSKSALVLLDKPGSRLSELQFQRDIFAYIEQLSSWIPEDWSAATAILTSLHSGIPHAVRAAL